MKHRPFVDALLIDEDVALADLSADAVEPGILKFGEARWYATRRIEKTADVERMFGLEPGTLRGAKLT